MKWYYAEGGKQVGPVEESALDDLVRQGVVRDDTLVWREGMAAWQRHASVRGPSPGSPPPPPAPAFDPPPSYSQPSYSQPAYSQPAYAQGTQAPGAGRHFGGFWMRFLAIFIDAIIIGVVGAIVSFPFGLAMGGVGLQLGNNPDPAQVMALLPTMLGMAGVGFLIRTALSLAYEVYFLTTKGATPGKMALGLKVITADGGPISVGLAVGRYFAKYLSFMTLCIGFIIAGFDREKRSLHDHICGTRVIYTR